jgi:hypothetical protein
MGTMFNWTAKIRIFFNPATFFRYICFKIRADINDEQKYKDFDMHSRAGLPGTSCFSYI